MAVSRKYKGNIQALAGCIELGLLQAVRRGKRLGFRLNKRQGDWLSLRIDFDPQGIVNAPLGLLACLPSNDFDGPGGLLAADKVFRPATGMNGGSINFARVSDSFRAIVKRP